MNRCQNWKNASHLDWTQNVTFNSSLKMKLFQNIQCTYLLLFEMLSLSLFSSLSTILSTLLCHDFRYYNCYVILRMKFHGCVDNNQDDIKSVKKWKKRNNNIRRKKKLKKVAEIKMAFSYNFNWLFLSNRSNIT